MFKGFQEQRERIRFLLTRRLTKGLTPEETQELELYCREEPALRLLIQRLDDKALTQTMVHRRRQAVLPDEVTDHEALQKGPRWLRYTVAAASIIAVTAAATFFSTSSSSKTQAVRPPAPPREHEGRNRATLTLADGEKFILHDIPNGIFWKKNRVTIAKSDSSLTYITGGKMIRPSFDSTDVTQDNVLETPPGCQYRITLPDGSNVWLNTASQLHFPTTFNGNRREVGLIGEAYFEVAGNRRQPFSVKVAGRRVDVLGTSFNISAYTDDHQVQTTLLTGKVRVSQGSHSQTLYPNHQLTIEDKGPWQSREIINPQSAIAWKENKFDFTGNSIGNVLRQTARWYKKSLDIKCPLDSIKFQCITTREKPLEELLKKIVDTTYQFQLKGDTIVIYQ